MRNSIVNAIPKVFRIFVFVLATYIFSLLSKVDIVDISYFVPLLFFVAIAASLIYSSYKIEKFNHDLQGKKNRYCGGLISWILIFNFSLPIVFAQLSVVLKLAGFVDLSKYIFENRFIACFWSTIVLILLCILIICCCVPTVDSKRKPV